MDGLLYQAFIYLIAAVASVPVAKRLGFGSVLGYLIAGILIGPFILRLVGNDTENVMHFAELGVVFMLFLIGLELQPSVLWNSRKSIFGLGSLQVFVTSLFLSLIVIILGFSWKEGIAIGLILSLSSTAIVLQTLKEKGLISSEGGRLSFSVLLFQDIAIIPILAVMPFLASTLEIQSVAQSGEHLNTFAESIPSWQRALLIIGIISSIIIVGRFLIRPIFHFIAQTKLREIFTAFALLLVIGITLSMQLVGLSPALGTFLAGVVLAESEYRHELEATIDPFKGLLLGLFFISVGASINFNIFFEKFSIVISIVFGLMVLKFLILLFLGRIFKMNKAENLLFSFSLCQGGEFAFVLFSFATQNSVLPESVSGLLIVVVAISMILTPLVFIFYEKVVQKRLKALSTKNQKSPDKIDQENEVIIAGFGRFGQIVGRLLHAHNIGTTVLDHDASQIEFVRQFGYKVFYGDISKVDLLESAGAAEAKLFILAVDDKEKVKETAKLVKKHFPNLKILARSYDRRHTYDLMELGVDTVRRETFYSALQLGADALVNMGFSRYQAHRAALKFMHHDDKSIGSLLQHVSDERTYLLYTKQRNEDLLKLFEADEKERDLLEKTVWEMQDKKV
ncbi:MAG: monovalent cation:proton antiporter-2 (CPA2) family protein [Thermodesulfobacteriota bacterium]